MLQKKLLARILKLDPEDRRIDLFLSDMETGEIIQASLDEINDLSKRISAITKDIRRLCKLSPAEWDPMIKNAILTETKGNKCAMKRTLERKKEIQQAVKVAIQDGMGPSDIRTIIEVMVMGMQPGDASYLVSAEFLFSLDIRIFVCYILSL